MIVETLTQHLIALISGVNPDSAGLHEAELRTTEAELADPEL
jgi:hypothetical protein